MSTEPDPVYEESPIERSVMLLCKQNHLSAEARALSMAYLLLCPRCDREISITEICRLTNRRDSANVERASEQMKAWRINVASGRGVRLDAKFAAVDPPKPTKAKAVKE
jgi:hypothetical protein